MKRKFLVECAVCLLLLSLCIFTSYRKNTRVTQTGTFGSKNVYNDTLSDLTNNIFEKIYYE